MKAQALSMPIPGFIRALAVLRKCLASGTCCGCTRVAGKPQVVGFVGVLPGQDGLRILSQQIMTCVCMAC